MKHCRKCDRTKPLEDFNICRSAKDGRQGRCRECETRYRTENSERIKAQKRQYVEENKEKRKTRNQEWRKNNPDTCLRMRKEYEANNMDKILAQKRKYYARTREERLEYQRGWREKNKERMREYRREYMKNYRRTNPNYAIRHRVSNRVRELLIDGKQGHTIEYLGCSIGELKKHIESQFTEGMTWERFLVGEIHIDHIKPCCSFDLTDPEQQKQCFHWSNLQPLWWKDNLSKISQDLSIKRDQNPNSRV